MSIFSEGEMIVIERKGKPWKLERIEAFADNEILTVSGHWYDALTNMRVGAEHATSQHDRLVKYTVERAAFLEVREFLEKKAKTLKVANLELEDAVELARLVRVLQMKLS